MTRNKDEYKAHMIIVEAMWSTRGRRIYNASAWIADLRELNY